MYDFEKEKELLKFQHEQFIREQKEDIVSLSENLRLKNKELKNVRALAQVMLNQRSEIEQFFLEALEQIKDEIRKKIALERKQKKSEFGGVHGKNADARIGSAGLDSFGGNQNMDPNAIGGSSAAGANKPYSEKVDLNDLDWEDRERVLRLLFSKMNTGMPANAQRMMLKSAGR